MASLVVISLFFSRINSQYTQLEENNGICQVAECTNCCYSGCDTKYDITSTDTAALDLLKLECEDLLIDGCSQSDYIYSNTSCTCPICTCSGNTIKYAVEADDWDVKCYECPCETYYYKAGSYGYNCDTYPAINEYDFDFGLSDDEKQEIIDAFECPPPICDYNGIIKYAGQTWWDESDTSCQSFCLCKSDTTYECSSVYADILSNSDLKDAFLSECAQSSDIYGTCASNSDLWVFPDGYSCGCPRCSCEIENDIGYFTYRDDDYGEIECYECVCSNSYSYFSGALVWDCDYSYINRIYFGDDIDTEEQTEIDAFECPPPRCDYHGTYYYEGDYWWNSTDINCETFCVCKSDETYECSSSYADIEASTLLKASFIDDCSYSLDSCVTDSSRWFSGSSYCTCPRCSCADGYTTDGDQWWEGYTDEEAESGSNFIFSSDAYYCYLCTCSSGTYGPESECTDEVSANWDLTDHCADDKMIQCYEGDDDDYTFTTISALKEYLSVDYCEPFIDHCSVDRMDITIDSTNSALFGSSEGDTNWDCSEQFLCDVMDADDECVTASFDLPMYYFEEGDDDYCDLVVADSSVTKYKSCCTGDLCNAFTLNTDQCTTTNDVFQSFSEITWKCTFGSKAWWETYGWILWIFAYAFGADVCPIDATSISGLYGEPCDIVKNYMEVSYACPCFAYSELYNAADQDDQIRMESYVNALKTGWISTLNDEYQCGLDFVCNLEKGTTTITDYDYILEFGTTVNCYDSTSYGDCDDDSEYSGIKYYMQMVLVNHNITMMQDNIEVDNCEINNDNLEADFKITFGGETNRDTFNDALNDDKVNWFNNDCTTTITDQTTSTDENEEEYEGPEDIVINDNTDSAVVKTFYLSLCIAFAFFMFLL